MKYSTQKYLVYSVIFILIFPALIINLGLIPVSADEATRAIVALEMNYSGNYLTPTINGELYFNKPPLYNWFLAGIFKLTGSASEFILRIPTVFFLLIFGLVIYLSVRKFTGDRAAVLGSLAFITSGRILFYDSMLGLIDTSFSLLIFLDFIVIYHIFTTRNPNFLFLVSYFLITVTFMLKGLPAIVFQGLTILVAAVYFRKWKKIFSLAHASGIILFLCLTGTYYFLLSRQNPATYYFETLFSESAKRTFIEHGFISTLVNLFTFPFEQIYHLLPWSVLMIFLIQRSFYRNLRQDSFKGFLALIFIANIPVYWISVEDYPRYMFMLYPVLLVLLLNHYISISSSKVENSGMINGVFKGMILLAIPTIIVVVIFYPFQNRDHTNRLLFIFAPVFVLIAILAYRKSRFLPEFVIIFLLILRTAFNLVVLPEREATGRNSLQRQMALEVAGILKEENVSLQYLATCSHETTYYIMKETGKILRRYKETVYIPGGYYIFDDRDRVREGEEILYRFETRWENSPLRLSRFKEVE